LDFFHLATYLEADQIIAIFNCLKIKLTVTLTLANGVFFPFASILWTLTVKSAVVDSTARPVAWYKRPLKLTSLDSVDLQSFVTEFVSAAGKQVQLADSAETEDGDKARQPENKAKY
jgi:hypothetical protein